MTELQDDDEETKNIATKITRSALPKDHENYSKWFYRDPQGDLQGRVKLQGFGNVSDLVSI